MSDIVQRLRDELGRTSMTTRLPGLAAEAADEIERLCGVVEYAKHVVAAAYSAAELGYSNEVLLHLGHLETKLTYLLDKERS